MTRRLSRANLHVNRSRPQQCLRRQQWLRTSTTVPRTKNSQCRRPSADERPDSRMRLIPNNQRPSHKGRPRTRCPITFAITGLPRVVANSESGRSATPVHCVVILHFQSQRNEAFICPAGSTCLLRTRTTGFALSSLLRMNAISPLELLRSVELLPA